MNNVMKRIFAVYQGEELLVVGTARECAEALGVKVSTIRFNATPSAKKRLAARGNPSACRTVIRVDDDE